MNKGSIFKAIRDHYLLDTSTFNEVRNNFFLERRPQAQSRATVYPYIVIHIVGGSVTETFDYNRRIEITEVLFSIYDKGTSADKVCTIYNGLTIHFDRALFEFADNDYKCIRCMRTSDDLELDNIDEGVWKYDVSYEIWTTEVI